MRTIHLVLVLLLGRKMMVVIANEGSSPGRKGFKMLVSKQQMHGTIGGGIMEHKLVEYAESLLEKTLQFLVSLHHQGKLYLLHP